MPNHAAAHRSGTATSIPVHTTDCIDGSAFAYTDRIVAGLQLAVANVVGSGNGSSVTTAVSFSTGSLPAS
jgi:hypothetical protein